MLDEHLDACTINSFSFLILRWKLSQYSVFLREAAKV